jgi:CheY-like chemotaxis protein
MYDGKVGPVSEENREFLGDILTSARHLLRLINDILDISKIEAGKLEAQPEECDLVGLAHEVQGVVESLARQKSIEILFEGPAAMPASVDPARFKQVLYNYLSNAVKFTPENGRVTLRLAPDGDSGFRIEVEDTGRGIPAEDIPRLFGEFAQLEVSRKEGQGSGLGLAVTKRLVEAQGGRVGVRSAVGQGSLFFAVLPRTPSRERLQSAARPHRQRAVLVVDSDGEELQRVIQALEDAGYAVEAAGTRTAAAAQCVSRGFDAIVLDLDLPDAAGRELLDEIRASGPNRATPVIAVSASPAEELPVQGWAAKPVQAPELLDALERASVRPPARRTVLVIGDDPATARLARATLTVLGYTAVSHPAGKLDASEIARARPVAILLDPSTPVRDQHEFLEMLQADGVHPAPPVIVWTNKDLTEGERRRLQRIAYAVLAKQDCTPKALLERLQALGSLRSPAPGSAS